MPDDEIIDLPDDDETRGIIGDDEIIDLPDDDETRSLLTSVAPQNSTVVPASLPIQGGAEKESNFDPMRSILGPTQGQTYTPEESFTEGAADAVTFGLADEAAGAFRGYGEGLKAFWSDPVGSVKSVFEGTAPPDVVQAVKEGYLKGKYQMQGNQQRALSTNPAAYGTGNTVGALGSAAAVGAASPIASAAGIGATSALGHSDGSAAEIALDTAGGAAGGAALGMLSKFSPKTAGAGGGALGYFSSDEKDFSGKLKDAAMMGIFGSQMGRSANVTPVGQGAALGGAIRHAAAGGVANVGAAIGSSFDIFPSSSSDAVKQWAQQQIADPALGDKALAVRAAYMQSPEEGNKVHRDMLARSPEYREAYESSQKK